MITLKIAALAAATMISMSSSAFAGDRSSLYPEGSICALPSTRWPRTGAGTTAVDQGAQISPRDPLDAPDAGNGWKPSNRDAGNLSAQRIDRQRTRVQPQAWEFMPPYGKPDLSPESARAVDELYHKLMGKTRPGAGADLPHRGAAPTRAAAQHRMQ
jgi:hypothetical protein